jgi:hypothetical protein
VADAKKPQAAGPMSVAIVILLIVAGFWAFKQYKESRTHPITFRALGVQTCRVRIQFDPGKPLDPIEQQTGVITPWQRDQVEREGTQLSLRVYGDASCEAITCEIAVDGVVISRKTTQTKGKDGVDSASCQAMAVKTSAQ